MHCVERNDVNLKRADALCLSLMYTRRNVQTHLDHLNLNFSTLLKTLVFLVSLQLRIFPFLVSFSYRTANISCIPESDSFTKGGTL